VCISLEPHIRGTTSVLAKTSKALQPFPMDDGKVSYDIRLGHPEVHGGANAAFGIGFDGAVMGDAAAIGTKVKGDAGFAPRTGGSDIRACGTGKLGPVTHEVISPQHAIAAADGAVAGGGAFRRHVEFPAGRAAMTAAFDHAFTLVQFGCGPSLGSSDNADFAGDKLPFSSSLFRAAFIVGKKISARAGIPVHRPIDRRFGAAVGIFGRLKKESHSLIIRARIRRRDP